MIQVTLLMVRVPGVQGMEEARFLTPAFLCPMRIDTVTPVDAPMRSSQHLPEKTQAVIRYDDRVRGYRLMYVAEEALAVARMRMRAMHGEDPGSPDFGMYMDGP